MAIATGFDTVVHRMLSVSKCIDLFIHGVLLRFEGISVDRKRTSHFDQGLMLHVDTGIVSKL